MNDLSISQSYITRQQDGLLWEKEIFIPDAAVVDRAIQNIRAEVLENDGLYYGYGCGNCVRRVR